MTSQSCKTYLEWAAAYENPPALRGYVAYAGFKYTCRALLLAIGSVYRNREILDLRVDVGYKNYRKLVYHIKCIKCKHTYWIEAHNLQRVSEKNCPRCNPAVQPRIGNRKYPDFAPGTRMGRLVVLYSGTVMRKAKNKFGQVRFKKVRAVYTQCDCGNEQWVLFENLLRGGSTQCATCAIKYRKRKRGN